MGELLRSRHRLKSVIEPGLVDFDLIAGGLVTGYGNRWTRERVTSLRSHHRVAVYKPADDGIEPWLNLSKAARLLRVARL
jgi:hypothetical protein